MNMAQFRKRQPLLPFEAPPDPAAPESGPIPFTPPADKPFAAEAWLPPEVGPITDHQTALPQIARNSRLLAQIEQRLRQIPSEHHFFNADARALGFIPPENVHLVLTSPPYWTLKEYRQHPDQLGSIAAYDAFLLGLEKVWRECSRALVPGGRLVCVVGDVCLSRRKNRGEHTVVPLHAAIVEQCRRIGYSNLAPIIWNKIANANYEAAGNGGGFLGKPYEPNAVVKNDIEFILMQRKAGGYRSPSLAMRILSVIPADRHKIWFQQIWTGLTGASTREHPAPFPLELAERLVRMFSFVGDTVLDPFAGTGTTSAAAGLWGRNSIGIEVDPHYFSMGVQRVKTVLRTFNASRVLVYPATTQREPCSTSTKDLPKRSVISGGSAPASRKDKAARAGKRTPAAGRP
jgi:DNA modification methylase